MVARKRNQIFKKLPKLRRRWPLLIIRVGSGHHGSMAMIQAFFNARGFAVDVCDARLQNLPARKTYKLTFIVGESVEIIREILDLNAQPLQVMNRILFTDAELDGLVRELEGVKTRQVVIRRIVQRKRRRMPLGEVLFSRRSNWLRKEMAAFGDDRLIVAYAGKLRSSSPLDTEFYAEEAVDDFFDLMELRTEEGRITGTVKNAKAVKSAGHVGVDDYIRLLSSSRRSLVGESLRYAVAGVIGGIMASAFSLAIDGLVRWKVSATSVWLAAIYGLAVLAGVIAAGLVWERRLFASRAAVFGLRWLREESAGAGRIHGNWWVGAYALVWLSAFVFGACTGRISYELIAGAVLICLVLNMLRGLRGPGDAR